MAFLVYSSFHSSGRVGQVGRVAGAWGAGVGVVGALMPLTHGGKGMRSLNQGCLDNPNRCLNHGLSHLFKQGAEALVAEAG